MRFVLLNFTQRTDLDLSVLAKACEKKLAEVAVAWSVEAPTVRVIQHVTDAADGDCPILFVPAFPPQDAVYLAFHTESTGIPYALVLFDDFTTVSQAQQCAWHEMAEALVDKDCNRYDPDGYSIEICDPVQSENVVVDGCRLSPFVTPAWFDLAPGPTCSDGVEITAHTVKPGGYTMMKRSGEQIMGALYVEPSTKWHYHSRPSKRRRACLTT